MHKETFQWRHNERNGVSNHRRLDCLSNRLFRRRSKKTFKLRVAGLREGKSPVTGEFPAQKTSNAESVSIWWRRHGSPSNGYQGDMINKSVGWSATGTNMAKYRVVSSIKYRDVFLSLVFRYSNSINMLSSQTWLTYSKEYRYLDLKVMPGNVQYIYVCVCVCDPCWLFF